MPKQNTTYLMGRDDLEALGISYSNAHLLRLEENEQFPKRIYLSPHRVAWFEQEILAWLKERAADRTDPGRCYHD